MEGAKQNEQLSKRMANHVISEIQKDIQNEVLSIKDKPANINQLTHRNSKKDRINHLSNKRKHPDLESLQELKHSKLIELREIERHEDILKKSVLLTSSNASRSFTKLLRSEYTEEQMSKIKEILKKQKEFANQLHKKEKQLADYINQKQKQDEQLRNKILSQKCEERKSQLKKQREEEEKKKEERKHNFQIEIKKLKELKQKKLLHQTMEQKFQKQVRDLLAQKEKAYERQKERKKQVSQGIQEHEKHYLELKKEKQEKRQNSLSKSKYDLPSIKSKIWLKLQKNEQQQQKIREWEEKQKDQQLHKRKIYSKQIKEIFFPKLKPSNVLTVRDEISEARKGLDLYEEHKVGNEYMKAVHQNISQQQLQRMKKSLEKADNLGGHSIFYKNYLSDLKQQSRHQEIQLSSLAFEQTAANENLQKQQKLQKLKKMLKLKQRKLHKNSDHEMVDSIKSKLLVLKEMIR